MKILKILPVAFIVSAMLLGGCDSIITKSDDDKEHRDENPDDEGVTMYYHSTDSLTEA